MGNRPQWQFHHFRAGGITFCHGFSSHSKRVHTWTKCFPYLANTSTTLYPNICWSDRKDKTCVYIISKNYEITYTSCSITKHTEWFGHHLVHGRLKRHATCLIAAIQRRTNMPKLRGEARVRWANDCNYNHSRDLLCTERCLRWEKWSKTTSWTRRIFAKRLHFVKF